MDLLWWSYNATFMYYKYLINAVLMDSCVFVPDKEWNLMYIVDWTQVIY